MDAVTPPSPPTAPQPPKKRLALFLDGTWNTVGDNTNVWRLRALCARNGTDGCAQLAYYNSGLGTRFGEKIRGGMFGYGIDQIVRDAYEWLVENYNLNDEIFIFGFSRGAYTARSLAGLISKCGLATAGAPLGVGQLYDRYRRPDAQKSIVELIKESEDKTRIFSIEEGWMLKYSHPAPIKMIAVWDTVGELGVPFPKIPGLGQSRYGFLDTNLRLNNEHGFHALAIDERRLAFAPTLWTKSVRDDASAPAAAPPRTLAQVEQRWFVGVHANVGGGYESDLLAQIPLKWMMRKASILDLEFRADVVIDADAHASPIQDSYGSFMYGAYRIISRPHYRAIGAPPLRKGPYLVSTINESIDASVFDRWKKDKEYRPRNLALWANGHEADIDRLDHSIRADDPQAPVPD